MRARKGEFALGAAILLSAALIVIAFLSGCGGALDGAKRALAASERSASASISSLEQFDAVAQRKIVVEAKSADEGKAKLEAYRAKRAPLVAAINQVAAVDAVGRSVIALAEQGLRDAKDLAAWLSELFNAGVALQRALLAFGVGL